MPTPKSLRAAPARTFEDYILTLTTDFSAGLTNIPQEKFIQVPDVGGSGQTNAVSNDLDIGFLFSYDGKTYEKFVVCTSGWTALVAPGYNFSYSHVMQDANLNTSIKSTFQRDHSLFAVWFGNLRNSYETPESLSLSANAISAYEKGLSQPDIRLNPRKYGIQYYRDNQSPEGRRLIVRWRSLSYFNFTSQSVLEFEFVLYENGKIEYRYSPKTKLTIDSTLVGGNTVGVFMPGGTYRFRDFSYELDYRTSGRLRYKFGGFISGSFNDGGGVPYGAYLLPQDNWPGNGNFGAIFTFQPPLNRRKVLPRSLLRKKDSKITLPTVARTGDSRPGNQSVIFDDRKSIVYSTKNVNFPTTLPRFYASGLPGVAENQDLFAGDFNVTSSVIVNNVQDYLEENRKEYVAPFSENKLFENDPGASSDKFFMTGSSINDVGEGFNQSLKSKTQIRLSFKVDHKTKLFGASSSIYYFNTKTNRWQYPTASFANGQFDIANPYGDASADRVIEVERCFNAIGFNLISGSANRSSGQGGTDLLINSTFNSSNEIEALIKSYEKNVQIDSRYAAINDESFLVPIQQPFLLEKAVIEIPIEAGSGWFNDKTRCFIPLTNATPKPPASVCKTFDIGGPGVTFALFNQVAVGTNKSKRDLILSGTFTHQLDNVAELTYSNFPDVAAGSAGNTGNIWQLTPRGFNAYATPTAVVYSGSVGTYTGSVVLKCESAVTNGVLAKDIFYITQAFTGSGGDSSVSYAQAAVEKLLNSETWGFGGQNSSVFGFGQGNGTRERTIISINNFGRSSQGFEPSGRSILGKENVTDSARSGYNNPFYLYKGASTLQDLKNIVSSTGGLEKVIYASSVVSKQKSVVSPYLLLPGDRLVLSISKSRPVFFNSADVPGPMAPVPASPPYTSGSIEHDIKLTTGSINITLYGSLVADGREFHDTLNQPLSSDAIHEVVIGGTKTW